MFIRLLVSIILCLTAGISLGYSQDKLWDYEIGLESYKHRYNEIVNNSFFMRDKGVMYGINLSANRIIQNTDWKLALEYGHSGSKKISYRSDGTGSMNDSDYMRLEIRYLANYNVNSNWDVFFGLGYRILQNDDYGKLSSTGNLGYFRESRYTYLPIGVAYTLPYSPLEFSITTKAEYDYILHAEQYSGIATPNNNRGTFNRQNDGFGARIAIDGKKPNETIDFIIGAFIRHWSFGDSETVVDSGISLTEPKNRTFEIGAKIGIAF